MTEDPITRGIPDIAGDIDGNWVRIARQRALLTNGQSAEQVGDVPSNLEALANELLRLARELAAVWPAKAAA
jgi:hypothetical protein